MKMDKRNVWVVILLVLVVSTGTVFAGGQKDSAANPTEKTMKVGISVMFSHPFFDTITEGVKSVMEPAGYTIVDKSGEFNVQAQIADVEDFIVQKVDAIFIEPHDSVGIKPALIAARKAGIPVICLDSPAEDVDLVAANCATDNYDAGVKNAEQLIKDLNGKGKIIVLDSPQANSSLLRGDGFLDTLKAKAPGIKVVSQQDYAGAQDKALVIMANVIQGQPEVDAIYATNENGILGAIPAVNASNRDKEGIKYYSVDGSSGFVEMVSKGEVAGLACQQPYKIGQLGAQAMMKVLNGETIEKQIQVPVVYITPSTVNGFKGF